ncbi:MAG: Gfo/Idh/MocA family oxidoreductase [Phycisphaerae bacterium]
MSKVRVAIIGQGRSGRDIHANWLLQDKRRFQIVAVADPIPDRRDRAAREIGCDVYPDHTSLLKRRDIDVIINASPSHLHMAITLDILKSGHHCVTEKPLAQNPKDVDKMIAAAQKSKVLFTVYQQSRFAPYFQQVRKVIDSGVLGEIIQINIAFNGFGRRYDWQTLQDHMAGNLLNTGPHPLDQALQLFGPGQPHVTCFMDRAVTSGDAEDHVLLILRGKHRPLIEIEVSSVCPFPTPIYKIYATQGGLEGSMTELKWKYFIPKDNPKPKLQREPLNTPEGTPAYPAENLRWIEKSWTVPPAQANLFTAISRAFYTALYNSITKGTPLAIKLEEVRRQAWVIDQCQKQNPHIYKK